MHGVEAFINAYQGASTTAAFNGFNNAGIPNNEVLIFSKLMDAKSLFLTANADTIYFWSNLDVTEGPIVVETPPMSLGIIDDMWFNWVTDFGLPGPDRGAGGKYCCCPPVTKANYRRAVTSYRNCAPRGHLCSDAPSWKTTTPTFTLISSGRRSKYIPICRAVTVRASDLFARRSDLARTPEHKLDWSFLRPQPSAKFHEGSGKVMNTVPPSDFSYFELINELVQKEPVGALDPEIMGSLAAIGIVKGKPFNPDARMKKILNDAAAIGSATGRTLNWNSRPSEGWYYYPNSAWTNMLFQGGYNFETPPPEVSADGAITVNAPTGARTLNARTAMFYYATGIIRP